MTEQDAMVVLALLWLAIFFLARNNTWSLLAFLTFRKVVQIRSDRDNGVVWYSPVKSPSAFVVEFAYRYPTTGIGSVTLFSGGRADYCGGQCTWRYVTLWQFITREPMP
jgi:hypothetical protein